MPPAMRTPGSWSTTIGLVIMLLSVSVGMHFGGFILLLCLVGVLVSANLLAFAVRTAERPAAMVPMVSGGAGALAAFMRRNATAVGLVMASCAATMLVSGEAHPVLCFATFTLLLLGISLINIGTRSE